MNPNQENPCNNCTKLTELKDHHQTMISRLSHEIRNPLTLVYSSLQLLEKEVPKVRESFLWPQTKSDIKDTIRLLQDVSILNRSSKEPLPVFAVFPFLKGIVLSFQALMQERGIIFQTRLNPQLSSLTIQGDEIKIKEALMNLLLNGADALNTGSHPGMILFTADFWDHQLILHIRDNGPGIPSAYLPTLFTPFVSHKSGGTGLGLSIAQQAALSHGGSLTVETSTTGDTYTDFCFSIPVKH